MVVLPYRHGRVVLSTVVLHLGLLVMETVETFGSKHAQPMFPAFLTVFQERAPVNQRDTVHFHAMSVQKSCILPLPLAHITTDPKKK